MRKLMRIMFLGYAMFWASFAVAQDSILVVQSRAEVAKGPDYALLSFGYETLKDEPDLAAADLSQVIDAAFAVLAAEGIDGADIDTQGMSLDSIWLDEADQSRAFQGYKASTEVRVMIRNVFLSSRIVNELADTGVNNIGELAFEVEDVDALVDLAMARAVRVARRRALAIASAGNMQIVRILRIEPVSSRIFETAYEPSTDEPGQEWIVRERAKQIGIQSVAAEAEVEITFLIE